MIDNARLCDLIPRAHMNQSTASPMKRARKTWPNRVAVAANLRIAGSSEPCQLPLICPATRQNQTIPLTIASVAALAKSTRVPFRGASENPALRNMTA